MLKRAWLSVSRRRVKTLILAIVLFVIANLVLASILIKNATGESLQYAKESLGGEVYLTADMEKIRSEALEKAGVSDSRSITQEERRSLMQSIQRPTIYVNDVKEIATSDYVKDYSYLMSASANVVDIETIETNTGTNDLRGPGGAELQMGDIRVESANAYAYINGVSSETITLSSGEAFNEDDLNQVILSTDLATLNDLAIGDTFQLTNIYTDEIITLTVKGIYDSVQDDSEFNMIDQSNNILMNTETAYQFLSEEDQNEGNYAISSATYYLKDAADADAFIEDANTLVNTLSDQNLLLDINARAYENMVGPIESVGDFATTILVVVVAAAVVITSLIITGQTRERNYEIGVLLALGETRKKITTQIVLELFAIATIVFALSLGTSTYVSKMMADQLLEQQIASQETQQDNNFGRVQPGIPSTGTAETIATIEVNPNMTDYVILYGVGYAIIIGSLVFPAIFIMRYEPKKILSRNEG